MKTASWTPSGAMAGATAPLALTQRFAVYVDGIKPTEVSAVSALYLAIVALRAKRVISVSTLEGVEVAHNRGGTVVGDDTFMEALYLMDQSLMSERTRAIHDTMDDIAARAGIDLEAELAAREQARG